MGRCCPHRTNQQGRFPPQCGFPVCRFTAAAASRIDQKRMESYREQPASEVLHPDRARAKETQQRNARMATATRSDRQNLGGVVTMSLLRAITSGLGSLFRKEQVDRELDEELRGFPADGCRRKDEARYEPQGRTSSCAV